METDAAPQAEVEPLPRASDFFRSWTVATTVAYGVTGLISMLFFRSLENQRFDSKEFLPALSLLMMLSGGLIALAQRLALRRAFRESACWGWVLVTVLAKLAGGLVVEVVRAMALPGGLPKSEGEVVLCIVLLGIMELGTWIAQAVYLVRVTGSTRFGWWPGVSLAALIASGLGSALFSYSVSSSLGGSWAFFESLPGRGVLSVVLSLLQGAGVGLSLGWVLSRWLLRAGRLRRGPQ